MGNRAVLSFGPLLGDDTVPGVYLHWNGGRASVEGFLRAARALTLPATGGTPTEQRDLVARLALAFIGSSVYVGPASEMDRDNWDNGIYRIENLEIVERGYTRGRPEEIDPEKTSAIAAETLAKVRELGGLEGLAALKPQDN